MPKMHYPITIGHFASQKQTRKSFHIKIRILKKKAIFYSLQHAEIFSMISLIRTFEMKITTFPSFVKKSKLLISTLLLSFSASKEALNHGLKTE